MWNITHPDASTTTRGRQTATTASPTSRRRRVGSCAQRERDREPDGERRERDDERRTGSRQRAGSRRPRRSADAGAARGRPRPSAAGVGCERSRCRCRAPARTPRRSPSAGRARRPVCGCEARNQSRSNSFAVSATSSPALRTSRASPSSTTSPKESVPRWSGCVGGPPQQRADTRRELAGRERLRDVVVRAELEADDPVGLLAARRQQDDREATSASGSSG